MRRGLAAACALAIGLAGWAVSGHGPRDLVLQGTVETGPVHVGSRIGGRVRAVLVEEGATVDAGAVLVQFEDTELTARKEAVLASLRRARDLPAMSGLLWISMQRQAAEAPYVAALAEYDSAQNGSDPNRMEAAKKKLERAAATREQALKRPPEPLGAADAAAQLRLLDLQIAELTVRAPSRAVVETLVVRPGDLVAPGRPVAVLIEPEQAYVLAFAKADAALSLRPGIATKVWAGRPPSEYDAVIQHIASAPEYSPRGAAGEAQDGGPYFAVKVRTARTLATRPGTPARITISSKAIPR